jgi:NAD(P)-dependent dehydrogenase (short-subunit alcohol dehydrogenase family)
VTRPEATAPVALVTGAAGHIGTALLRLLPAAGYQTVGLDRGPAPARRTMTAPAAWWTTDLADPDCEDDLRERVAALPRLDVLVNGAGVTALGDFEATDDAAFRRVMDVNYHGALRVTRAALPALLERSGHLVAVSSVAGILPTVGRPAYVGAKHAVTGVFRALGAELAEDGVAVTVAHPSFLATPVTDVGAPAARSTTGAPIDADDVARAIVRVLVRRRRTGRAPGRVLVGRTAHLADIAHRLLPDAAVRVAARSLKGPPAVAEGALTADRGTVDAERRGP